MPHHNRAMGKRQFRIGELATMLNVEKYIIRFWEKEFALDGTRSDGGQRFYTADDIKKFTEIKELLYVKGFTIAGARQQLTHPTKETVKPARKPVPLFIQCPEAATFQAELGELYAAIHSLKKRIRALEK